MDSRPNEPIRLVPRGKIRCYMHDDKFRQDTPEEHVRQRVARSLVEEYGYSKHDIELEFPVQVGSGRKRADIVIFPEGADHTQETVAMIVETKRDDVTPTHRKKGVEQLLSYLSVCLNARWGLWVGSEMQAYERLHDPTLSTDKQIVPATDIPLRGEDEPRRKKFSELVPATDGLRSVFKRCHNYLHVNGNLSKERAFFDLLKLIFCKVFDEETTHGTMEFSIAQEERRSELGQRNLRRRIEALFARVMQKYPYIFTSASERIELDNRSLAYVVSELEKYNFEETQSDIKGEAYEELVSVTSRRDSGAFFTPRNVCDMAVAMVFATYPSDDWVSLSVLDPACGTGGFLRAALLNIKSAIVAGAVGKWSNNEARVRREVADRLTNFCNKSIHGVDKLSELVRAAQMNLAMHGDGSTNVHHANSLLPPGEWSPSVRDQVGLGRFNVVFTNPPFGSKLPIDDPHILDQFELAVFGAAAVRSSMPPEQLFIERCLRFLKPGGRMAIVLPDSILSNPGLTFIRKWMLMNAYVLASVDLPKQMFARSDTGTLTSVLVLQKFTDEELRLAREMGKPPDYQVFMAIADEVGWDLRGNPVFKRTPSGEQILATKKRVVTTRNAKGDVVESVQDVAEPIRNDQLPMVAEVFAEWLGSIPPQRWMHA